MSGPLEGIRVIDAATILAGPFGAMILADFGAEVIKVEHPRGDPVRNHGYTKDGVPLWWKVIGRNKRAVTLNLSKPDGQDLFRELVGTADVLIENFRPGTLERWNLAPDALRADHPSLVIARVTGFGQFGPYANRPGFGTLAEAMTGFAFITGEPDGPPTLPPFGLADAIAGQAMANAVLMALYRRDVGGGTGQVIDVSLLEPLFGLLGPQSTVYDQLGIVQQRAGNRSVNNAPRNLYRTRDGHWVAVASSAESTARRVMQLIGHPEVAEEEWFASGSERAKHSEVIDARVKSWIAERDLDDVVAAFESAEAALGPVYDVRQIMEDPHFQALEAIIRVEDPELGSLAMQNVMFRMAETPGAVRWAGRELGADNYDLYVTEMGLSETQLEKLIGDGVV